MVDASQQTVSFLAKRSREELHPLLKRHDVDDSEASNKHELAEMLLGEIRLDGSNSIASFFRGGEGVRYEEVVANVVKQMKIYIDDDAPLAELEWAIVVDVIERYFENAPPEDQREFAHILQQEGIDSRNISGPMIKAVLAGAGAMVTQQIVARVVAMLAARQAGKRAIGVVGAAIPLLNVALAGWAVVDLLGPAYRKIVPSVIEISFLKLKHGAIKSPGTKR